MARRPWSGTPGPRARHGSKRGSWTPGSSSDSASSSRMTGALPTASSTGAASARRNVSAIKRCCPRDPNVRRSRPCRATRRSSRWGPTSVWPRRISSGRRARRQLMKRRWRGHITQCRSILDSNTPTSLLGPDTSVPPQRSEPRRPAGVWKRSPCRDRRSAHSRVRDDLDSRRHSSGGDDCDAREPVGTSGGSTHTTDISLRRTRRGSCGAPAAPH